MGNKLIRLLLNPKLMFSSTSLSFSLPAFFLILCSQPSCTLRRNCTPSPPSHLLHPLERAGSYLCPGCLEIELSTCLPTNSWLFPHWMNTEPSYLISVRSGLSFGSLLWSGANLHKTGSLSEISVLLSNFVDIGQWPNNYQGQRDGQTDNTMAWDFLHWESVFKLHQSWKIMRCFDFMNIFLPLYSPFLLNLLEHKAVICPLLT